MKTYDSVLVARYLLAFSYDKKVVLNMTKLQKLLYILYGFYLAEYGFLILNETPKIWPFGPVFPHVHKKIDTTKIADINEPEFTEINTDTRLKDALTVILEKYAKFSATQLSNWSHMEGSPWDRTVKESRSKWNTEIPREYISSYFSALNTI